MIERPASNDVCPDPATRVLVVDDYPATRASLCEFLEAHSGFEVVGAAADGEQALELAIDLAPDLILMDINLPGMDGLHATELIQERQPTRVIVVSIHDGDGWRAACAARGAQGFVPKHRIQQELLSEIRRVQALPQKETPS